MLGDLAIDFDTAQTVKLRIFSAQASFVTEKLRFF